MLREISPITCKQFVTPTSPAVVYTVVQLGFTPPFKYIVIGHNDESIINRCAPTTKDVIEKVYNISL